MKRNLMFCIMVILAMFFLSQTVVFAGDYKSKKFPSNDLIIKNVPKFQALPAVRITYAGKQKIKENYYEVYFAVRTKYGVKPKSVTFIKLDTNYWVMSYGGYNEFITN